MSTNEIKSNAKSTDMSKIVVPKIAVPKILDRVNSKACKVTVLPRLVPIAESDMNLLSGGTMTISQPTPQTNSRRFIFAPKNEVQPTLNVPSSPFQLIPLTVFGNSTSQHKISNQEKLLTANNNQNSNIVPPPKQFNVRGIGMISTTCHPDTNNGFKKVMGKLVFNKSTFSGVKSTLGDIKNDTLLWVMYLGDRKLKQNAIKNETFSTQLSQDSNPMGLSLIKVINIKENLIIFDGFESFTVDKGTVFGVVPYLSDYHNEANFKEELEQTDPVSNISDLDDTLPEAKFFVNNEAEDPLATEPKIKTESSLNNKLQNENEHSIAMTANKNNYFQKTRIKTKIGYATVYRCLTCNKLVRSVTNLTRHVKSHPRKCSCCDKLFAQGNLYNKHMKVMKNKLALLMQYENKTFEKITMQSPKGSITVFKCLQCNKMVKKLGFLNRHLDLHTKKQEQKSNKQLFYCDYCKRPFTMKSSLKRHIQSVHCEFKPYKCSICDTKFVHAFHLCHHLQIHVGKPIPDETIESIETGKSELDAQVHSEKSIHQCCICKENFSEFMELKTHILQHASDKFYDCDICNRSFRCKGSLIIHTRSHTGEKPYECSYCKKAFNNKSNLRVHIRAHTGYKPYKCTYCDYASARYPEHKNHLRMHTGERPYVCDTCGKMFTSHTGLIHHKQTHRNQRNYQCDVCGKAFARGDYLKRHILTHFGERSNVCSLCNKGFLEKQKLRRHLRNVHSLSGEDLEIQLCVHKTS